MAATPASEMDHDLSYNDGDEIDLLIVETHQDVECGL